MKLLHAMLLVVALGLSLSTHVYAQGAEADKATARALAIDAHKALDAGDYVRAADLFERAERLYHAPTLLLGLGRAYVHLGKYVEAMESFNKIIREKVGANATEAFVRAQEDARREVVGLDEKIGWVTISVTGPSEPEVKLDGAAVSVASLGVKRAANPGDHVLEISADGYLPAKRSFSIQPGATEEVALAMEPAPEPVGGDGGTPPVGAPDTGTGALGIAGWVAIGVGGAGLVLGAVTGGLAIGKHGELSDNCPNGICATSQQDTLDSYQTLGTISTVGFIAGGVLAATGVVLVLVAPSGGEHAGDSAMGPTLRARIGPGSVGAALRF